MLTLSILKKTDPAMGFKQLGASIFKRPFRLAIPMFACLLLSQILSRFGAYNSIEYGAPSISERGSWGGYFLEVPQDFVSFREFWTFTFNFFLGNPVLKKYYPIGVIWTITVELVGSWVIFLVTCVLISMKRQQNFLLGVITFFMLLINSWNAVFVIGLWMAVLSNQGFYQKYRTWRVRLPMAALAFCLMSRDLSLWHFMNNFQIFQYYSPWQYPGVFTRNSIRDEYFTEPHNSLTLCAFLILWILEITPWLQRLFSTAPLVFLGKISYGVYLGHPFVMLMIMPSLFHGLVTNNVPFGLIVFLSLVIYIFCTLVVGYLVFRVFDTPAIAFAKWLYDFLFVQTWDKADKDGNKTWWAKWYSRRQIPFVPVKNQPEDERVVDTDLTRTASNPSSSNSVVNEKSSPPTPAAPSQPKLWYLEALRGVAAFIVALSHFKAQFSKAEHGEFWDYNRNPLEHFYTAIMDGQLPVYLFFLLSGRVLTLSMLQNGTLSNGVNKMGSAIFRRPFRLAIPVFGGLILSQIFSRFGAYKSKID